MALYGELNVRLTRDELEQLRRRAARLGIPMAGLVRIKLRTGALPLDEAPLDSADWRLVPPKPIN